MNKSLKRSMVNRSIEQAMRTFAEHGLHLPPFAFWTPSDWAGMGPEADEIRDCMLGWDVTDFGLGQFELYGRTLFTLRNGQGGGSYPKTYAEKFILDPPGQRAPLHYHAKKREDIINRGQSGIIVVEVRRADARGEPTRDPFDLRVDGIKRRFEKGPVRIRLEPGRSVCLEPGMMHQFWGEEGGAIAVSGEVSSVCDDNGDNFFHGYSTRRFPPLVEDEAPRYYLCHEYPKEK